MFQYMNSEEKALYTNLLAKHFRSVFNKSHLETMARQSTENPQTR